MAADLDAIQARADAAIPGPWIVDDDPPTVYPVVRADGHAVAGCSTSGLGKWPGLPNAEHIAGLDPQITLALVAELRAAREVIEVARTYWSHEGHDLAQCTMPLCQAVVAYDKAVN